MCHNKLRAHTTLYSSSRVEGPSQCPRVHEVHWASITGSWTCVSPGEYDVVSMGVIAAAFPILERNGPCISCPNYRQPPQYWHDGQNVHNLLFWKEFVDQFGAAFGDPRLWQGATGSSATYYVILTRIITYYFTPEGSSLISQQKETKAYLRSTGSTWPSMATHVFKFNCFRCHLCYWHWHW